MRVLPAHGGLDDIVQVLERRPGQHLDPAPDGGFGIFEDDLEMDNGIAHAARVASLFFQFQGSRSPIFSLTARSY
jgi:hypothetical protein